MKDLIKRLWARAVREKAKDIARPAFTKNEKIRLKHELEIISQTKTAEQIISFINQADEARKTGRFYTKGAANCSFLLYTVGATTINPMLIGSQFERFINPLMDGSPYYEIASGTPKELSTEEEQMLLNELIIKRAVEHGFIKDEQLKRSTDHPSASSYQFVEDVLFESNGNIIWQEQVIELLYRMGGFSYAEADLMRRDSAKGYTFDGKWFATRRKRFMDNALHAGYDYYFADKFFRYIFEANMHIYLKAHVAAVVLNSKNQPTS